MFGDKAIDKWRSVEVSGMSFYQYIEAPLTTRNILSLSGELSTQNGTGIVLSFINADLLCEALDYLHKWILWFYRLRCFISKYSEASI